MEDGVERREIQMIFCNITDELIDELVSLVHNKVVVDCGAGECMLEQESQGKLRVISLDICPRDPKEPSIDCTKMPFHKGQILVFIRPSHGGWVETTIENNQDVAAFFLYIGLDKNLDQDLGRYQAETYVVSDWIGDEGERIYRVDGAYIDEGNGIEEYFLIGSKFFDGKWWVKNYDVELYENISGSRHPIQGTPVYGSVRAASFNELDWSETYLTISEDGAGWLDREARFFGCPREQHDNHAYLVLQKEVRELERRGWVRINSKKSYQAMKSLSPKQRMWLDREDYDVEDDGHL